MYPQLSLKNCVPGSGKPQTHPPFHSRAAIVLNVGIIHLLFIKVSACLVCVLVNDILFSSAFFKGPQVTRIGYIKILPSGRSLMFGTCISCFSLPFAHPSLSFLFPPSHFLSFNVISPCDSTHCPTKDRTLIIAHIEL